METSDSAPIWGEILVHLRSIGCSADLAWSDFLTCRRPAVISGEENITQLHRYTSGVESNGLIVLQYYCG